MIPGIFLMILMLIPMFYAGSLRKADEHCLDMFSRPQPEVIRSLPPEERKEHTLNEIRQSCPKTDYDDLMSRIK